MMKVLVLRAPWFAGTAEAAAKATSSTCNRSVRRRDGAAIGQVVNRRKNPIERRQATVWVREKDD